MLKYIEVPGIEQWRPVPGYEGLYEVSDKGRIKRLPRVTPKGSNLGIRILSASDLKGYLSVKLADIDMKNKSMLVHRLVAIAFVPGRSEEYNIVNHLDGDKQNNAPSNLEWTDASGNSLHAWATGLTTVQSRIGLTHEQIMFISEAEKYLPASVLAEYITNGDVSYVQSIWRGDSFSSITGRKPN